MNPSCKRPLHEHFEHHNVANSMENGRFELKNAANTPSTSKILFSEQGKWTEQEIQGKKTKQEIKTSQNNFRSNVKCNVSHCNDCNVVQCNVMECIGMQRNGIESNVLYGNGYGYWVMGVVYWVSGTGYRHGDGIVGYGHGGGMAGYEWYGTICVICMDACNIYIYICNICNIYIYVIYIYVIYIYM